MFFFATFLSFVERRSTYPAIEEDDQSSLAESSPHVMNSAGADAGSALVPGDGTEKGKIAKKFAQYSLGASSSSKRRTSLSKMGRKGSTPQSNHQFSNSVGSSPGGSSALSGASFRRAETISAPSRHHRLSLIETTSPSFRHDTKTREGPVETKLNSQNWITFSRVGDDETRGSARFSELFHNKVRVSVCVEEFLEWKTKS